MPPDFFSGVTKLQVGQISRPIRSRLGFHIVQLTDSKPARQISFDEATTEIGLALENQKRQDAVEKLMVDLCRRAHWLRAPSPAAE
jgi:parvulin-like peptidyl-prolyl isomerase